MITVGIDEVGRGCWAGPVVAGAVILPDGFLSQPVDSLQLKDSKVLSKKQRNHANDAIKNIAVAVGLGWVNAPTIDRIGLTAAVALAMQRAIDQISVPYNEVIIDGNFNFLPTNIKTRTLIHADATIPAVSAASIIAKVARDNYMASLNDQYGFAHHVGYGTALHASKLRELGVSDWHRRSVKPVKALLQ